MRAQLLFLIVFFNSFLAHNQIILNKIESIKNNDSYELISADIIGEIFFLEDNNLRVVKDGIILKSSACLLFAKKRKKRISRFLNNLKYEKKN